MTEPEHEVALHADRTYYPSGGMEDFLGSFDDFGEAWVRCSPGNAEADEASPGIQLPGDAWLRLYVSFVERRDGG